MLLPFHDSDIPTMLADFGVPIVIGTTPGTGIVDLEDQPFQQDGAKGVVFVSVTKVLIQTSAFPGIHIDDSVILDGANYTIRAHPRTLLDGALTEVFLGVAQNIFDGGAYTDTPGPVIGDALYNPAPTGAPIDGGGF